MATNSQFKYKQAISWCEANKSRLPAKCKFKLMTSENLYALIDQFGAVWSPKEKCWLSVGNRNTPVTVIEKQGDWRGSNADGKAIIRIIAHRDRIDQRTAEFLELCEALNWHVVRVGEKHRPLDGDWLRQMITIQVAEED